MRSLVRSSGRKAHNILVLGLLQCAVLSQFSADFTNAATEYQAYGEMSKLEGSTARFRELLTDENFFLRNLLQETENEDREEQDKANNDEKLVEAEEHSKLEILNKDHPLHSEYTVEQDRQKVEGEEEKTEDEQNPAEGKSSVEDELQFETEGQQEQHEEQNRAEGKSNFEEDKLETETEGQQQQQEADKNPAKRKGNFEEEKAEEGFVFPEPYLLGPTIKDWDEQRESWLNENPHMKTTSDGKPRVLIVTGSQPWPCRSSAGELFHVKALKLKIDYARMHNYEIYYNLAWLDPLFGSFWVKLPTIRTLMLTHPEIEWFFWVDSDAMFTDMLFEAPWASYEGYNMIMWGITDFFYAEKAWTGFNAGVFMIRNCQWTLDLIDKWSPMGPEGPVRDAYGKILTAFLAGRNDWTADDQGALAYLMINDEAIKAKVKLVDSDEYMISGWWIPIVDTYEELMEKYHPGLGDHRWPWITHFTGCGPCHQDETTDQFEKCMKNLDRAFNFADNQVLAYMGFQHKSLDSDIVIRVRDETDHPLDLVGVNPWAERIAKVATSVSTTS